MLFMPLGQSIGDPFLREGEDAGQVIANRPAELDEGLEPRASGPGRPAWELLLRSVARQHEDVEQRLLEEIATTKGCEDRVVFLGGALDPVERRPHGALDLGLLILVDCLSHQRTPHLVQGLVGELRDLEVIEDDLAWCRGQ